LLVVVGPVFAFAGECAAAAAFGADAFLEGGLDLGLLSAHADDAISRIKPIDQFRAMLLCGIMAFLLDPPLRTSDQLYFQTGRNGG